MFISLSERVYFSSELSLLSIMGAVRGCITFELALSSIDYGLKISLIKKLMK